MIPEREVIELVTQLVKIDSANPWLVKAARGGEVVRYMAAWLEPAVPRSSWKKRKQAVHLIAKLPGSREREEPVPLRPQRHRGVRALARSAPCILDRGDRLYGCGSADDKGHCAAAMLALKSIAEKKALWRRPVAGAAHRRRGHLQRRFRFRQTPQAGRDGGSGAGWIGEDCHYPPGFGWLDIVVKGKAAHGSAPEVGVDAILHMAESSPAWASWIREKYRPHRSRHERKDRVPHRHHLRGTDYATYPAECVLASRSAPSRERLSRIV